MNNIVTRFAPSPTGYLHIGAARTALFNYLFAKANRGKFLLRIEDTDRKRSTQDAVRALLNGLKWLELDWDEEEVYQFSRSERHKEVALELLERGKAYKCFLTPEELEVMRIETMRTGCVIQSPWRDADKAAHPDLPYVIRIKAPREGVTIVDDKVQGKVITENHTLDDMILLRSDGTPTYMHAVVVDDHDMGITHIIRGDDHLGNAARQMTIYNAMEWKIPVFAHIPLIHGEDGKKLSKRHGALGVEEYSDMGYLPEALCNYLLRLGWSHGNDEIINREQALEWFNLESIGKSPARLDFKKLDHINNHYLQLADNGRLIKLIIPFIGKISEDSQKNILEGMNSLKQRSNSIIELAELAKIYIIEQSIKIPVELKPIYLNHKDLVYKYFNEIMSLTPWNKDSIMTVAKNLSNANQMKIGEFAAILRVILTGSTASPSVFEIIQNLKIYAFKKRIDDAYNS